MTLQSKLKRKNSILCDAFGCEETYPIHHEAEGEPGFVDGKFLGWVYLDLNRVDLFPRTLRFCSLRCLLHWMEMNSVATTCARNVNPVQIAALRREHNHELNDYSSANVALRVETNEQAAARVTKAFDAMRRTTESQRKWANGTITKDEATR